MTPEGIVRTYLVTTALYTLATSMIWGINTLFLMDAGLDIFQVMLVNAAFAVGMVAFEVPTGVIADTLGRKTSFLICIAVIFVSTLAYVSIWWFGWGIWPFVGTSVLLGLGFTFFTGAVEAWLVDALDHTGFTGSRERIFARSQMVFSGSMLFGTVGGGVLGQVNLALPYLVRAGILVPTFVVVALFMRDLGFEPRHLKFSNVGGEAKKVFVEGMKYGWNIPIVKFCVFASFIEGLFFIFGWYSWQRYFLDLLNRELIWVAGVVSALFSFSSIAGNALVGKVTDKLGARSPAKILAWAACLQGLVVVAAGLLGVLAPAHALGLGLFAAAVGFYLVFGVVMGVAKPVRQGFLNRYIPSAHRATVLSLDSLFFDMGGVVGQTGLGYLSRAVSIPVAWVLGGAVLFFGYPLYRRVEREESLVIGDRSSVIGNR